MPDSIKDSSKAPISAAPVVEGVDKLKENDVKEADVRPEDKESKSQRPVSNEKQEAYGQNETTECEEWEEQVDKWLAEELTLTESQKKLNSELLHSLRRLGFHLGVYYYGYNGAPVLGKFLEEHKNDKDLKTVLNLQRGEAKTTILHEVAHYNIHAASLLLDAGASPNVRDKEQKTLLHHVAEGGYIQVAGLFLDEKDIDVNAIDNQGKIPLHYAAYGYYEDIVERFLKKGADVTTKDKNGYTALHYAVTTGNPKILEMLVSHHARSGEEAYWKEFDWTKVDWSKNRGLEEITEKRNEKAKALLTSTIDEKGNTLLHFAALHGDKEIIGFLVENGVDINAKNGKGITPAQVAAKYENEDFIDFLIESKNAQCIKTDIKGWTPLNIAIRAAWDKDCSEEKKERLYRVIEKLAPFSDIEAFRPKDNWFKKIWNRDESFLVKAANEDKKIKRILDNTFRGGKLKNMSVVLPHSDSFYNKISPNTELRKLERIKNISVTRRDLEKLHEFLSKVREAKDVIELSQIVDGALKSGIRLKFYQYNFVDQVIAKIEQLNGVAQDPKVVSGIVCQLAAKGAVIKEEIDEELEDLFKDHKANMEKACCEYEKHISDFRTAAAEASSNGKVNHVEIDNTVFYLEYPEDSRVEVAKAIEGARKLGLQKGDIKCGGNIVKIGDSAVEVETEHGIRNYTDISDGGNILLIFQTSVGELKVRLYNDIKSKDLVKVEVCSSSQEIFNELSSAERETIGKNCRLGDLTVYEAIKWGDFERSGKVLQSLPPSETIKKLPESAKKDIKKVAESISSVSTGAVEKKSWADKTKENKELSGQGNFLKSAQLLTR